MKFSKIFLYLFKTKLYYIFISLLILTLTVQIVDFIELARININKENFIFSKILKMSFLKTPYLVNEILPFAIIVSTTFYYKNLIDNNELVSIRNVGLSILNIFYHIGLDVLSIGILSLLIINPIEILHIVSIDSNLLIASSSSLSILLKTVLEFINFFSIFKNLYILFLIL